MSPNRKHVITPNSDASKAEEIAWLENLALDIQSNTYLDSLFTPHFVAWVSEQIRNDFNPDLLGALELQHILNSQTVLQAEREAKDLVATKALEIQQLLTKLDDARKANSDLIKNNDSLRERIEFLEDQAPALIQDCNTSKVELRQANLDLSVAEQKVIELKARLFDLIDRK